MTVLLTECERREAATKAAGAPYADWFAGRRAAKEAVIAWLRDRHGIVMDPKSFAIGADDRGRPCVVCDRTLDGVPHVAITHEGGVGLAVAADRPVGIDLCRPDPRLRRLARRFVREDDDRPKEGWLGLSDEGANPQFVPLEVCIARYTASRSAPLPLHPGGDGRSLAAIWSAKEAVMKCHGLGMGLPPLDIRIRFAGPRWFGTANPVHGLPLVAGRWWTEPGGVVAMGFVDQDP